MAACLIKSYIVKLKNTRISRHQNNLHDVAIEHQEHKSRLEASAKNLFNHHHRVNISLAAHRLLVVFGLSHRLTCAPLFGSGHAVLAVVATAL